MSRTATLHNEQSITVTVSVMQTATISVQDQCGG